MNNSPVSGTTYSDTTASGGTLYYYTVKAVNASGNSAASDEASALTVPAAPTGLIATDDATNPSTQIDLSWTASSGTVSGYNVFRGTSSSGENYNSPLNGSTLVTGTAYSDTTIAGGNTYYYTVEAVNGTGSSAASNEADGVTLDSTSNTWTIYVLAGQTFTCSGLTGDGTLVKTGPGNLILSGTNTYTGGTDVEAGTLQIGDSTALGMGNLIVNGGTLDLNGYSITVGSLSGNGGTITDNSTGGGTTTLTVDQTADATYAGTIADGQNGTLLALTKDGAGTLVLSGDDTYHGFTTVMDGLLDLQGSLANSQVACLGGRFATAAVQAVGPSTDVTGLSTALSVQNNFSPDDTNLTYTWAAVSYPTGDAPTFSDNGTTSASDMAVTFPCAGDYAFTVTINDGDTVIATVSTGTVTVDQTLTSIAVSGFLQQIDAGGTDYFIATAYDQFGNAITPQPAFTWELSETSPSGGSANDTDENNRVLLLPLYTAPDFSVNAAVEATATFNNITVSGSGSVIVVNQPPQVTMPVEANPSEVERTSESDGKSTLLSVKASDDGGTSNLTYLWTAIPLTVGDSTPSFDNATAQDPTATFTSAGDYRFTVTIADNYGLAGGLTTTSVVDVVVDQTLTSIIVSPAIGYVNAGGTEQFSAAEYDQFGKPMDTPQTLTWQVDGGSGTIDDTGLYTAPDTSTSATVQASYDAGSNEERRHWSDLCNQPSTDGGHAGRRFAGCRRHNRHAVGAGGGRRGRGQLDLHLGGR